MANKKLFTQDPNYVRPTKKKERLAAQASDQPTPAIEEATAPVTEVAPEEPVTLPVPAACSKTTKKKAKAKSEAKAKVVKTSATKPKKLSMVQAARQVLQKADTAMSCSDMIQTMTTQGLWSSPAGKTPANTLYAAITRLIKDQGKQAPFIKADKGLFALNPAVKE